MSNCGHRVVASEQHWSRVHSTYIARRVARTLGCRATRSSRSANCPARPACVVPRGRAVSQSRAPDENMVLPYGRIESFLGEGVHEPVVVDGVAGRVRFELVEQTQHALRERERESQYRGSGPGARRSSAKQTARVGPVWIRPCRACCTAGRTVQSRSPGWTLSRNPARSTASAG